MSCITVTNSNPKYVILKTNTARPRKKNEIRKSELAKLRSNPCETSVMTNLDDYYGWRIEKKYDLVGFHSYAMRI